MKPFASTCTLVLAFAAAPAIAQGESELLDASVIQALLMDGADLSKPHDIDFFLVLPDKVRANAAAVEVARLGYVVLGVRTWPGERGWEVHATRRMAPQLEAIKAATRELDALAWRHGGHYDGWDTFAVR